MKTNGLRNKKPAMARAAWRIWWRKFRQQCYQGDYSPEYWTDGGALESMLRWHRAAKGRK